MSPEQASGKQTNVGPASDVYSLGAVLYASLTGRAPFVADSPVDTLFQVMRKEPVSPRVLNPSVPMDLENICLKCIQKEPERRYETAKDLASDLKRFLSGEPVRARPIPRRERVWRWCRRNPLVATLSASLAVALIVGVIGITTQWIRAENSANRAIAQEQLTQRHLFAAHMNLAAQAFEDENTLRAIQLLDQYNDASPYDERSNRLTTVERRHTSEDLRSFDWHYLWRQTHRELSSVTLDKPRDHFFHEGRHATISPDGRLAAVLGRDNSGNDTIAAVRVLDAVTAEEHVFLDYKHTDRFKGLVFSPDSQFLAAWADAHKDGLRVVVWNLITGRSMCSLHLKRSWGEVVTSLSNDARRLAVGGSWNDGDATLRGVRVFDIADGEATLVRTLRRDKGNLPGFALLSPDGHRLLEGLGRQIQVFDLKSDSPPQEIEVYHFGSAAISPDGQFIAAWYGDQVTTTTNRYVVEIFEAETGEKVGQFEGRGKVHDVAFSQDNTVLATAHGSVIRLWDRTSGQLLVTLRGHTDDVRSIAFGPDGRTLTSSCSPGVESDGAIRSETLECRDSLRAGFAFHLQRGCHCSVA